MEFPNTRDAINPDPSQRIDHNTRSYLIPPATHLSRSYAPAPQRQSSVSQFHMYSESDPASFDRPIPPHHGNHERESESAPPVGGPFTHPSYRSDDRSTSVLERQPGFRDPWRQSSGPQGHRDRANAMAGQYLEQCIVNILTSYIFSPLHALLKLLVNVNVQDFLMKRNVTTRVQHSLLSSALCVVTTSQRVLFF